MKLCSCGAKWEGKYVNSPYIESQHLTKGHDVTDIPDIPRSRGSDPETSRLAEKHMKESGAMSDQQGFALCMVMLSPGETAREYDEKEELPGEGIFHRRLIELERKGLVRRGEPRKCRIGGRQAHTWYPTEVK